jgi:hypothetical protein
MNLFAVEIDPPHNQYWADGSKVKWRLLVHATCSEEVLSKIRSAYPGMPVIIVPRIE